MEVRETLWKRCLSTPIKPPAKNSNICPSETTYQHKETRKKCKKTNQAAIIQWQRQRLMDKPHRKPWPKSKTSNISKHSPSLLHHTFLLGRARFTAQPLSALLANVTSKRVKLTQTSGKMLRVNVPSGDGQWKKESRKQTWNFARKLREPPSPQKQLYFALFQLHLHHVLHSRIGLLDRHSKISVERSLGTLWSLHNIVFFIASTLHLDEFFN